MSAEEIRFALAEALMDASRAGNGVTSGGGDRVVIDCPAGVEAITSWLEQRYLVIPRSDITTEYGVQAHWTDTSLVEICRDEDVARYRSARVWSGRPVVSRETWSSPWTASPGCPSQAVDGAHAWQADVDTPPGVVACAVCPATTQWPLPEDGDGNG